MGLSTEPTPVMHYVDEGGACRKALSCERLADFVAELFTPSRWLSPTILASIAQGVRHDFDRPGRP